MWTTLERVLTPASLDEALALAGRPGHALAGGGRFLADERPASIHTLVAIRGLLPTGIEVLDGNLVIGAGCTLEWLRRAAPDHGLPALARALAAQTPEPNLRHQSLLGGALAHARDHGPLATLCLAAGARLRLHGSRQPLAFEAWGGTGLITALEIPANTRLAYAGLSLLPAARPLVFAALGCGDGEVCVTAGSQGTAAESQRLKEPAARPLAKLAAGLAARFQDDAQGSSIWKTRCLAALLEELEARTWK